MTPLTLLAEILFLVLFVATLVQYLRRRDPVSRDVMLVFSPLAVLLILEAWDELGGGAPDAVSLLGGLLFLLQPVFALHLASLVKDVPRWLMVGAAVASLATGLPVVFVPELRAAALVAVGVFIAIELIAGLQLLLAARRRRGPGATRMYVAAAATALLAGALLVAIAGAAVGGRAPEGAPPTQTQTIVSSVASLFALLAAVGFVAAFIPPRVIRRFWQAGTTVEFAGRLIELADEPVVAIWNDLARVASEVSGAGAAVVTARADGATGTVAGTAGLEVEPGEAVTAEELAELASIAGRGPHADVRSAGALVERLAGPTACRFVSIVPVAMPERGTAASIVLLSTHRSLFHGSDLELLAALASQSAIVAERRAVKSEQDALSRRLGETVDALRAASEAKSDFLASMSHELRTPLSAILGFSDLMRREPASGDSVTVPVEWVDHIHRGGEHLLALINDVLDLAKVEAGRLELHPESLDAWPAIAETVNGLRPLADRKGLNVEMNIEVERVLADRGRLRQVLYNLLSNAIKYTPDGGTVGIDVAAAGPDIRIVVRDTGIGISEDDQRLVFEEFRQVGDPAERQAGTGLGLALTRRLVEAHGGSIDVSSVRGQGSTFTVLLPASPGATARPPQPRIPAAAQPELGGPTPPDGSPAEPVDILVIEDDPSAASLLREYLEPSGFRVLSVRSGEAGLEAIEAARPAAIILDVLLPGIDGWEVLRRIKANARWRSIPVVIVTVVDERQVGLALGAVDYLVKPIDREGLLAALARFTFTTKVQHGPVRILAVDDEPAALELVRMALEPEGFEVILSSGGRDALKRVREMPIDLVVCDLIMPDVDGFEVISTLKAEPATAAIPIIVCTAHDLTPADKERLNGKILGIVKKGVDARDGLKAWLGMALAERTADA